ncbi:MAG: hypothetical protein LBT62_01605 [Deltaproteobacteria bacterium]|nr:hypothetical protein [Deltaproteobacteria bacterium]
MPREVCLEPPKESRLAQEAYQEMLAESRWRRTAYGKAMPGRMANAAERRD